MMGIDSLFPDNIPVITEKDKAFAEDLAKRFGLPINDLVTIIWEIRWSILTHSTVYKNMVIKTLDIQVGGSQLMNKLPKIFKHDFEIQNISINTDKGKIVFSANDPYFDHFIPAINKIRTEIRKEQTRSKKSIEKLERSKILSRIFNFFYNKKLPNKSTILFATGLFMIHFELYGYKPILSEQDFTEDYGAYDYKHYLIDIVKRRLKKEIYNTYIEKPEIEVIIEDTEEYKQWVKSNNENDSCTS